MMNNMIINITEHLDLNIKKAASDTGVDCNALIVDSINIYLAILTLNKEEATILYDILNQQQGKLRNHYEETQ